MVVNSSAFFLEQVASAARQSPYLKVLSNCSHITTFFQFRLTMAQRYKGSAREVNTMADHRNEQKWLSLTPECRAFVKRTLAFDPDARPTAAQALQDPWFEA